MGHRFFSLEQANAALRALRPRLSALMQLQAQLGATTQSGHALPPGMPWLADPVARADEAHARRHGALAQGLYAALEDGLQALADAGVQVKDLSTGLVDFPSFLEGEGEVLLCWRLGEPAVAHFHSLTGGFAARRTVSGHTFRSVPSGPREPSPDRAATR